MATISISISFTPKILSEYAMVKFDVLEKSYMGTVENEIGRIEKLIETTDKSKLIFTEIVVSRAILFQKSNGVMRHELTMHHLKGSCTSEKLLALLQYKLGISSEDFTTHMSQFEKEENKECE